MISREEKQRLLRFFERNLATSRHDSDEGIGTFYERVVMDSYLKGIHDKYGITSVLESPADGVTGVPGINSLEFARNGAKVTLCSPSQMLLSASKENWEKKGLQDRLDLREGEVDALPFEDESFDLVWNFCMFERFEYPATLVREMDRVSKNYIFIMTQNYYNPGTFVHMLYHKFHHLEWDHGHTGHMRRKSIIETLRANNITPIEWGTMDTPPWMDTWDMPLRGELKKILSLFRKKWEWKSQEGDPATSNNGSRPFLQFLVGLEKDLPKFAQPILTHHHYVLGKKGNSDA